MSSSSPHSREWYERLARAQPGYYYPWSSTVAPGNGEDAYLALVHEHLRSDSDVLDVGCGHGTVALSLSPLCNSILAYDRVAPYVELARAAAQERDITNVRFVCHDSSRRANGGTAKIPADREMFDLLISRRGPLHWIEDARGVARPGATLIQLNPMESPAPAWNEDLPPELRFATPERTSIRTSVEEQLASGNLVLHSCWVYDVPEYFAEPEQLYVRLTWGCEPGEAPPFARVGGKLEEIFADHSGPKGLVLRHRRFLWKAEVE